jgi:mannose-6-phosphate isomerase-like protein (cupin superfamily)
MKFDLETTYLSVDGQGAVAQHEGGEPFWQSVDSNNEVLSTLIIVSPADGDWPHWEMHPQGDEILVMLEGSQTLVLDRDGEVTEQEMGPGTTVVVPAGVWHRAKISEPTRMLAITYGAGTRHRSL